MSVTPQISLIAYETRDPSRVFVRVPNERGRWILTSRCVVEVECPHCLAAIGEPCRGHITDYSVTPHFTRAALYRARRPHWYHAGVYHEQLPAKPRIKLKAHHVQAA